MKRLQQASSGPLLELASPELLQAWLEDHTVVGLTVDVDQISYAQAKYQCLKEVFLSYHASPTINIIIMVTARIACRFSSGLDSDENLF